MLHRFTVSESFPPRSATGSIDGQPLRWDRTSRASLRWLITGDDAAIAGILPIIDRCLPGPIHLYDAATIALVPPFSRGTLLLTDVDRLAAVAQDHLFDWLTENGTSHPRIVSTCRTPLWPLVERGIFRADLYYRLNFVSIAV
jgi:Sigma-54 interaction domain